MILKRFIISLAVLWLPLAANGADPEFRADLQENAASPDVFAIFGANGVLTNAGNTSAVSGNASPTLGTALTRYFLLGQSDSNDRVDITTGNAAALQNRTAATCMCWFLCSTSDTSGSHRMLHVNNGTSAGSTRAALVLNASGQVLAHARAGDGESLYTRTTTNSYDDGAWHLAASVANYGSDSLVIYIDGVNVAQTGTITFSGSATSNTASLSLAIGNTAAGTEPFKGRIAGVRIYGSDESANLAAIMAEKDSPASSAVMKILQLLSDARAIRQFKHFDTYGVYALAP